MGGKVHQLGPGNRFTPCVLGPSNTPVITELTDAQENIEFAVLSAIEHGQSTDVELATRIASAAIDASLMLDAEQSRLYLDLLLIFLSENARFASHIMAFSSLDFLQSHGFEYQSDFARKYFAEGKAELLLILLSQRFGALAEDVRVRVQKASSKQLNAAAERLSTAATLDEVLTPLP